MLHGHPQQSVGRKMSAKTERVRVTAFVSHPKRVSPATRHWLGIDGLGLGPSH